MQLIDPPGGLPWALLGLAGGSALLNVVLIAKIALTPDVAPCSHEAATAIVEPAAVEAPAEIEEAMPEAVVAEEVVEAEEPGAAVPEGLNVIQGSVQNNLAYTFRQITPRDQADVVSAVYARLFFWDLDVRRDLQKGDEVRAVYEWDGELAHIPAATYTSKKLGATLTAYRFQATGDSFASYWNVDGHEVPYRLKESPLADYEQVTSLLKDRPRHRGMDFKTPVGTAIIAPRAGTVTRINWNLAYNGNCIELKYRDGTVAKFLHLEEVDVRPGQSVGAGTRLGATGNTGRSTAPHLHYELDKNDTVVDPIDYHGVVRRSLPNTDLDRFEQERARLDAILSASQG